ncbi:MAG: sigma-70 family RNA polymerase sigma factor [Betaproteobacteria bacterium]|nr:sigma-70 family RNA polymerase sigma factor [Betaproteobacteria bacterium]
MQSDCILEAWRNHETELRAYLIHRLRDAYAADDLLQIIFLKVIQQNTSFCTLDNTRAWLFQIARNALTDQFRLAKPFTELSDEMAVTDVNDRDPIDELDACIVRNLGEMSKDDREILEQCDLLGIKQQTYAAAHDLSLTAVKSRLLRARKRLRLAITKHCQVNFDEFGKVCCHTPRNQDS